MENGLGGEEVWRMVEAGRRCGEWLRRGGGVETAVTSRYCSSADIMQPHSPRLGGVHRSQYSPATTTENIVWRRAGLADRPVQGGPVLCSPS